MTALEALRSVAFFARELEKLWCEPAELSAMQHDFRELQVALTQWEVLSKAEAMPKKPEPWEAEDEEVLAILPEELKIPWMRICGMMPLLYPDGSTDITWNMMIALFRDLGAALKCVQELEGKCEPVNALKRLARMATLEGKPCIKHVEVRGEGIVFEDGKRVEA